jgi:drug/metabolite transporter (DMT)-like permease
MRKESASHLMNALRQNRLMRRTGILLCLASAVAFGTMGIFGKLAYDDGATVGTLLAVRFSLAAVLFWALVAATGGAARVRALPARDVALAFALGAVGYSAQAGCFFIALDRVDASLLSLLVYTYPALVTVAAIMLGRERATRRIALALMLASVGLVLVLAEAGTGTLDPIGVALGLTAALVYTVYILSSEGISRRAGPIVLSAFVCTGAAITLSIAGLLVGDLHPGAVSPAGLGWLAGIAVISTVAAIGLFFAGLRWVGSATAAIVSTAEPLTTVLLAYVVLDESLNTLQLVGGALVISGVLVLSVAGQPLTAAALRRRLRRPAARPFPPAA